jgi:hypothetical protein
LGYANVTTLVSSIDFGSQGTGFGERISGFFIPPTTTNYVFFVCSDDDSDLFLSTDDQPSKERLIAQENQWSNQRQWVAAGGGGATASAQKRSDQWSPDSGVTMPYSGGIWLTNGNRYFFEVVHHEGSGGDDLGLTYKLGLDIANDPTNGAPSIITSSMLAHMEAPSKPVLTVTRAGSNLNISWTPAGGTLKSSTDVTAHFASWTTVGTANPATVPIGAGNLFLHVEQ